MSTFTAADYARLNALVFQRDYPGWRPETIEAPNGDGKVDATKRYAHVAMKYLEKDPNSARAGELNSYLLRAHGEALGVASKLGGPRPSLGACALRVLEYPAGSGSASHSDMGLFTLNLWRNVPNAGLGDPPEPYHIGELGAIYGLGPALVHCVEPLDVPQQSIIYFVLPAHDETLTVGQWLAERYARSRVAA